MSSAIPLQLQEVVAAWDRGAADSATVVEQALQLLIEGDHDEVVLPIASLPPSPGRLDLMETVNKVFQAADDQLLLDSRRAHTLALRWLARRYVSGDVTADTFCAWAVREWAKLNRPNHLLDFILDSDYDSEGAISREEFLERLDVSIKRFVGGSGTAATTSD